MHPGGEAIRGGMPIGPGKTLHRGQVAMTPTTRIGIGREMDGMSGIMVTKNDVLAYVMKTIVAYVNEMILKIVYGKTM